MDVLRTMAVLTSQPWLALIPSSLFLVCAAAIKSTIPRTVVFTVAALWFLYCLYEYTMKYRILCSGECNIRIDLMVVYPFLLVASLVGLSAVVITVYKRFNS